MNRLGEPSEVLFTIAGLHITPEVTTMWAILAMLSLISWFATRRLHEHPGRLQTVAEVAVGGLYRLVADLLGASMTKKYFSFFGALFIYLVFSNYCGLLPGAGTIPGFKAPTSSLSVTAGLAICVFFATQFFGLREHGLRYFSRFMRPIAMMLPFLLIDEVIKPVSLALRLFGNISGEERVTEQLYEILPIGAPLLMMALSLLFCAIQAMVFTMLTCIYVSEATTLE